MSDGPPVEIHITYYITHLARNGSSMLLGYALHTTVIGSEESAILVTSLCGFLGLLQGALGSLSGTWGRGLLIGVLVSGLNCCWWLAISCYFFPGVNVWAVTVWMIAGGAAGPMGGVVRQRLDHMDIRPLR